MNQNLGTAASRSLVWFCLAVVSLVTAWVARATISLDPYMDEIFHIPQAQLYCDGRFTEWDNKITTLPGLYLLSALVHAVAQLVYADSNVCSPVFLRAINLALAALIPVVAALCRDKLFRGASSDGLETALVLMVYPFTMFYFFLFYTDTLSTLSVLVAYYVCLSAQKKHQSVMGYTISHLCVLLATAFTILVRQTNAVWVLFIIGTTMLQRLEGTGVFRDSACSFSQFYRFFTALFMNILDLIPMIWSALLPVAAFVAFVVQNGSIVVGDKEHHEAVVHLAMPLHVFACLALLLGPVELVRSMQDLLSAFRAGSATAPGGSLLLKFVVAVALVVLVAYCLLFSCLDHEFLLSDNRHYTFYIWRYFLSKFKFRLALVVPYAIFTAISIRKLLVTRGPVWVSIFLIALVISLVPARLFEFRYLTPGVVMAYLNFPQLTSPKKISTSTKESSDSTYLSSSFNWFMSFFVNISFSIAILMIFFKKPFIWGDGSVARFMP